ncbi:MAG: hypothetical protein WC552_08265 [Candidatus Omnitrophota bacterium]
MKHYRFLFLILFLAGLQLSAVDPKGSGQQKDQWRLYGLASGIIEYQVSGSQRGKEVLFFDRWGLRQARYSQVEDFMTGIRNMATILDRDWVYTIDLDKKIGRKTPNVIFKQFFGQVAGGEQGEAAASMMVNLGAETKGIGPIMNRECEIWENPKTGSTYWLWKGIPLQTQIKFAGIGLTVTASVLHENADVPEEKFVIPPDIQFVNEDIENILLSDRGQLERPLYF